MKIRKGIALLLSLTLLCSIALPVHETYALEDTTDGWQVASGMNIRKTAVEKEDGVYTITLEAYATGSKVVTETTTDVPTDIILVLDQSGSMANDFGTTTEASYTPYGKQSNEANYALRHNGGKENLWYKLEDGSYVSVSVTREGVGTGGYTQYSSAKTYSTLYTAQQNGTTFYVKSGDEYLELTITTNGKTDNQIRYGYTYGSTTVDANNRGNQSVGDTLNLYTGGYSEYAYTYSYTADGEAVTIGTASTGGTTTFNTTFYEYTPANTNVSALEALQSAVRIFCNSVNEKAAGADGQLGTTDDINHRIAVVGFAYGSQGYQNDPAYTNTEVFAGSNQYMYGTSAQSVYSSAFQDVSTSAGQANITASIGALEANGATYTNLGMEMANGILNANPVPEGETRNRVVIVFTDGQPGYSSYEQNTAEAAITQGNTAKNTYGASVYTVGIFEGANATSAGNQNGNNTEKCNWFMQNLSSNNGTVQTPSYYLSAADSASLSNIFQQIADQIESGGASTTLDENTVIKDIIAPAFTLPEGATTNNITLEVWNYTGENTWTKADAASGVTATITSTDSSDDTTSNNQVSVTGFDFAENWVGTSTAADGTITYHGSKLVISFDVEVQEGFLGGNEVYTNTSAGVYADSTASSPVLTYERPQVNVAIPTVTVGETTTNVYLGADLESLSTGTIKVGNVELKPGETNYGLESWQNEYVDVSITYKDSEGNVVSSYSDLTEDKTYTVTVTVSPKTTSTAEDAATTQTGNASNSVNVFKPVLTYKDGTVYYGDTAPTDYSDYLTSTAWKHGNTASADVTMTSTVPTLVETYTPEEGKIVDGKINTKEDIAVDVAVKIGETDVTSYVTFVHTDCSEGEVISNNAEFVLHVETCSLTITKTGGANGEPYVFDIYKDGTKYTECSITGNDSKTIVELPVGTYTIQENEDWSWRYNGTEGTGVTLSAETTSGTITCTNNKSENYWLNGFSEVVKNIFGISSSN